MISNSKARKEYTCSKCNSVIKKGDKYFRGERFMTTPLIRCQSCGIYAWECSSSEYTQTVGRICDCWQNDYELDESTAQSIADELETLRDNCQDNLDNMPEGLQEGDTGQLLQERIDCLDNVITELEGIDYDATKQEIECNTDREDDESEEDYESRVASDVEEAIIDEIDSALSQLDY
jgi:DNA-directed RNA polymerase subunit RPC12/RpoP